MTRRRDPREMNGGWQMDLFPVETEPEPATTAGPAPAEQSPIGDQPPEAATTTVVDLHGRQGDPEFADVVYVGRPMFQGGWRLHGHVLANPYRVGKHGDAAAVVEKYRTWLDERPQLVARELPKLRGRRLGCWCPEEQPCHARVLAELADQEVDR
ncbi:DUF4326 domain-containing protein [Streptomyces sp. VN1]|uniref:DUF4326 domain-containing protein n=1 Tax=Streptomyces sp. VN1 TaxID=1821625 RepID=UPI0031FDE48C